MRAVSFAAALALLSLGACSKKDSATPVDALASLSVEPRSAQIDKTTSLTLRAVGVSAKGRTLPVSDVIWSVEGPATISDAGVLNATGAGAVTVTAAAEGFEGTAAIDVIEPGQITIHLIDINSGAALAGAQIQVAKEDVATTDGSGNLTITGGSFSGPVTLTAWLDGYWPITVVNARAKNLVVPVRPIEGPAPGTFEGRIDFEQAYGNPDPEPGSLYLGVAAPALRQVPLAFDIEDILSEEREISLAGMTIDAPGNVYVHNVTENYIAQTPPGSTAAFALGGEVELGTIVDLASEVDGADFGQIVKLLIPIFNTFHYTARSDVKLGAGETKTGVDMVLTQTLDQSTTLVAPPLPTADEAPLTLAAVDMGELGILPVGFGVLEGGEGTVQSPVREDALADGSMLFALVTRDGGLDSKSPLSFGTLIRGGETGETQTFPDFLASPNESDYAGTASTATVGGELEWASVPGTELTYHSIVKKKEDGTRMEWDIVAAADSGSITWPFDPADAAAPLDPLKKGAKWSTQSLALERGTFDSLLSEGASVGLKDYTRDANRVVLFNGKFQ